MKTVAVLIAVIFIIGNVVAVRAIVHPSTTMNLAAGPVVVPAASPAREVTPRATPTRNGSHPRRDLLLTVTAYCATGHTTASGVTPQLGMAASNLFAFGTRLRVPGIGVVTITDRIGAHSQLDLYMGAEGCGQRATRFGRRELTVVVLP